MDHKTLPTMSINDTTKGKFTSNDALHADLMDAVEAIPLLGKLFCAVCSW